MRSTRRQFVLGSLGAAVLAARRHRAPSRPATPSGPITFICPWPAGGTADVTMRALCAAAAKQLGQTDRGREQGRRLRHDRPEGAGEREARRLHDRPDPDLGDALLAARHGADRSAEGPDLHRAHLRPDLRHRRARRSAVEDAEGPRRRRQGQPRQDHLRQRRHRRRHARRHGRVRARRRRRSSTTSPTRAAREALQALLGGHVDVLADSSSWAPHVKSGKLRLLATWGEQRTNDFQDVPTLKERGLQRGGRCAQRHRRAEGPRSGRRAAPARSLQGRRREPGVRRRLRQDRCAADVPRRRPTTRSTSPRAYRRRRC